MIIIKNVKTLDGQTRDVQIHSSRDYVLDAKGRLLMLPGLIDSHISIGSPHQNNWSFIIESIMRGGITTILDSPFLDLPNESVSDLIEKKKLVDKQLAQLNIPLRYFMYSKGNSEYVEEMGLEKTFIQGSMILLTPDHQAVDDSAWNRLFQRAAWEDFPVVVNSRNENTWPQAKFKRADETLLDKAIHYAEKQNTRLYILNVATREEIELIQQARSRALLIYAETTPQHLFPIDASQADFLWDALNSGVIEIVGSGYQHEVQNQERLLYQDGNFDFLDPLFLLPLLLTAYHEGKTTIENIVRLTRANLYDIFKLENNEDIVLVDLEEEQIAQRTSKDRSIEMKLKGWPLYTIMNGEIFTFSKTGSHLTRVE